MLAKMVATVPVVFGAAYLFGVLISSFYLVNYSVHDLALFRADYILMGGMFLLYLMIPSMVVAAAIAFWLTPRREDDAIVSGFWTFAGKTLGGLFVMGFFVACSTILVLIFSIGKNTGEQVSFADVWSIYANGFFWLLYALLLLGIGNIWWCLSKKEHSARKVGAGAAAVLFLAISLLLLPALYANSIYPNLPTGLGGGKPVIVNIALTQDGWNALAGLGFKTDGSNMTACASVIHENSECYFLLATPDSDGSRQVVRLPKAQTKATLLPRQ